MSPQNKAQLLPRAHYSCPGKVFLFGEYAVLARKTAILAALGPRFELEVSPDPIANHTEFHPDSPAGRLLKSVGVPNENFRFSDPTTGGMGASSAQFALTYAAIAEAFKLPADWKSAWFRYRELSDSHPIGPSGADLVAQWIGGVTAFDPSERVSVDVGHGFDWSAFMVFSATGQPDRKVPTHEHLDELSKREFFTSNSELITKLDRIVREAIEAIPRREFLALGNLMEEYGEALCAAGLEHPATTADRKALRGVSGVLGVKGSGAMQADCIIALMEPTSPNRSKLVQEAEKLGLKLVTDALKPEEGLKCLKK